MVHPAAQWLKGVVIAYYVSIIHNNTYSYQIIHILFYTMPRRGPFYPSSRD